MIDYNSSDGFFTHDGPPATQLSKIKTVDQLVVRLLAMGFSKKDEKWQEGTVDGKKQWVMNGEDCPKDGEFAIVTASSRPGSLEILKSIPCPGAVKIHAKLKNDADAVEHHLYSSDISLAAHFDDELVITSWATQHCYYAGYKNNELVDPDYWSLDEINDLLVSRFMEHRRKAKEDRDEMLRKINDNFGEDNVQ